MIVYELIRIDNKHSNKTQTFLLQFHRMNGHGSSWLYGRKRENRCRHSIWHGLFCSLDLHSRRRRSSCCCNCWRRRSCNLIQQLLQMCIIHRLLFHHAHIRISNDILGFLHHLLDLLHFLHHLSHLLRSFQGLWKDLVGRFSNIHHGIGKSSRIQSMKLFSEGSYRLIEREDSLFARSRS